ncbi:MAG: sugar phosphate nucleotidyltransferase [Candidatus Kerfeldbacteria bacterium]|nr:sugar phosphate nucleotidyltransferase [Candidatus Kerfeldbacteria bacterium]
MASIALKCFIVYGTLLGGIIYLSIMVIVLRAGGVGSRLWPVSREARPKQFHALTSTRTMLQESYDRVASLVSVDEVFVSTNVHSVAHVQTQLPEVPQAHIIVEPARKDTAAAIGLESILIAHEHPDAVVASLGSDHSVKRDEEFRAVLRVAEKFVQAHPEYIVPIGIQPTQPDTGYGYIQCGKKIESIDGHDVLSVKQFREKPDLQHAKQFVRAGGYLWNANMFVWKVSTILELYKTHMPEMYAQLQEIAKALGTTKEKEVIECVYPQMEKIAVDYAIIEKTPHIAALSADIGWSDIGDWARLKDELAETEMDDASIGATHMSIKSHNTLVYSADPKKVIATIGLDHLIIVDTPDALLVCNKYDSQAVKEMVDLLKEKGLEHLL